MKLHCVLNPMFDCEIKILDQTFLLKNKEKKVLSLDCCNDFCMNVYPRCDYCLPYNIDCSFSPCDFVSQYINCYIRDSLCYLDLKPKYFCNDFNLLYYSTDILIYNYGTTHIFYKNQTLKLEKSFSSCEIEYFSGFTIIKLYSSINFVVVFDKSNTVIFCDEYSMFEKSDCLKILSSLNDFALQAVKTTIKENEITKDIVYENSAPHLATNKKLIPLAFLESIKVNNENLAKFYLSDELNNVSSMENLVSYFGDFKKCFFEYDNSFVYALLFYDDKTSKIFKFTVKEKIENIESIEKLPENIIF